MPSRARRERAAALAAQRAEATALHAVAPVPANDTPHTPARSQVVAVVSDAHMDMQDPRCWRAFRRWHAAVRPSMTVLAGDMVDLNMLSPYAQEAGASLRAVEQIQCLVRECNPLVVEAGRVLFLEGNHEARWSREVVGKHAVALDGSVGLSFREQCQAHGLDKRIEWVKEAPGTFGVAVGPFMVRHGHNQSGRFGGGMHIAHNAVVKSLGQSTIVGHHHRGQLIAHTAFGRTVVGIANPCMTGEHGYAPGANWQRGFTVLELHGPNGQHATPQVVLMADDGSFAWGGNVYSGAA